MSTIFGVFDDPLAARRAVDRRIHRAALRREDRRTRREDRREDRRSRLRLRLRQGGRRIRLHREAGRQEVQGVVRGSSFPLCSLL